MKCWQTPLAWLFTSFLAILLVAATASAQPPNQPNQPRRGQGRGAAPVALSPRDSEPWTPTNFNNINADLPTVVVVGDSTAATGGPTTRGWGAVLMDYFDLDKINVVNTAVGGRSFRTFTSEGRWDRVAQALKPGDFVIIELGHNDGGGAQSSTGRGDVPGVGEETVTVERPGREPEVVHTYGWYLRKYIREAVANGATPIVSTTTVRNIWGGGKVERGMGQMREWAKQVAEQEQAPFLDHSNIAADVYEELGEEVTTRLHPQDHTHTSTEGAIVNAETLVAGLKALPDMPLVNFLNAKGAAIEPHGPRPNWGTFDPTRPPRPSSAGGR